MKWGLFVVNALLYMGISNPYLSRYNSALHLVIYAVDFNQTLALF